MTFSTRASASRRSKGASAPTGGAPTRCSYSYTERKERKQPTYCAFIDCRKAYDSVWRDGLWQSLWDLQLRGKMYRMLNSMFGTMQRVVMIDGDTTEPFNVETGVAQRCRDLLLPLRMLHQRIVGGAERVPARSGDCGGAHCG